MASRIEWEYVSRLHNSLCFRKPMNLQEHIQRYVELVCRADRLFESVAQRHGELLTCKPGCDDCCSVFFQLSLIEAFFVSGMFRQKLSSSALERVLARAEQSGALFQQATVTLTLWQTPIRKNSRKLPQSYKFHARSLKTMDASFTNTGPSRVVFTVFPRKLAVGWSPVRIMASTQMVCTRRSM